MMTVKKEKYKEYSTFFGRIWGDEKPIAKLFRTARRGYLYDTGINNLMGCDDLVFELLENLSSMNVETSIQAFIKKHGQDKFFHAADSIKNSIKNHNILRFKKGEQFTLTGDECSVDEMIQAYQGILLLEVTERCNLRCGYCIYSPGYKGNKNHGHKDMSFDVAEKALLHLKKHSYKQERVGIAFHGGEPLLVFPLIKQCIDKARKLFKDKKIIFSITTNCTLITPETARFLYENDINMVASIDGPEPAHNSFRKYGSGFGSYRDTIKGFRCLVDAYGDSAEEKLRLNMVYTPPFSAKKLENIAAWWDSLEWLPGKLKVRIVYPSPGSIPFDLVEDNPPEDKTMQEWAFEKYRETYRQKGSSHPLVVSIVEPFLTSIMQRTLYNVPETRMNLNGCCVPAARRLFVTVDGNFHLCEKIDSNTPSIGNVYAGVDLETIKTKYISQYMDIAFPGCSTCWAVRLCDSCYISAFKDGVMSPGTKFANCADLKNIKEQYLKYFCTLMEDDPTGLDHLMGKKKY